jgi:RNA-directed DNA polymerase
MSVNGVEVTMSKHKPESPAETALVNQLYLMEEIVDNTNLQNAIKRVVTNRGIPGVDGMAVKDLSDYLNKEWPTIKEQLLNGEYKPKPVKQVEIPKPTGGVRKLGIPTVLDRCIQ